MKTLPDGMQVALDSGATTLCWCWRLVRPDGQIMGFTDHDRAITFDGTTYEAASGFTASEINESVGLSVDNLEVEAALTSGSISEADLADGAYDEARVEIHRVNWKSPEQRVLMRSGSLGEVRRTGNAFSAEVRGLAHYLGQPNGRLYQYGCDADVGDARCKVVLSTPAFLGTGTVTEVSSNRKFAASGLAAFEADWFARGLLTFTSGEKMGRKAEIKRHEKAGDQVTIEIWQEAGAVETGDTFTITAGCDKQFETCRAKFQNAANFRGFPHMPGNDFLTSYVRSGDA
ncbi:MAG: hypothetical protein RLZ98_1008 [Pseudomonadota bacterium]|jgi:uncharacterized phage protein (TIGR02218 family)